MWDEEGDWTRPGGGRQEASAGRSREPWGGGWQGGEGGGRQEAAAGSREQWGGGWQGGEEGGRGGREEAAAGRSRERGGGGWQGGEGIHHRLDRRHNRAEGRDRQGGRLHGHCVCGD
jgi:hypothetical protein